MTTAEDRRSLTAVLGNVTMIGITIGVSSPVLTLALERQGVDSAINGLMAAVPSLTMLLVGPVVPRIIGAVGTLGAMYWGVALAVVALLLFPVWVDIPFWFALRALMGAGAGLQWIASEVWINAVATDRNRGFVIGLYGALISAGLAAGPIIVNVVGSEGALPFVVSAGLLAASALPLLLARGLAPTFPERPAHGLARFLSQAPAAMVASAVNGVTYTTMFALLPLYALRTGFGEKSAVLMLTVAMLGNIFLQVPIGRCIDLLGSRITLVLCAAIGIGGAAVLPLTLAQDLLLWPLLFFWGGTLGATYTVGMTLLGQQIAPSQLAGASTTFVMVYGLASIVGPTLAGVGMDLWDPHGMLVVMAAASAGLLLPFSARARARPPT